MQEINMRNAESKLMINSLDLLRNETVERTKEYFTIEHQTVKHNEEVAKMLKEERIKRHNANMEELKQVTIKGWSDIKGLSIKSKEELDVLNQKVEERLVLG